VRANSRFLFQLPSLVGNENANCRHVVIIGLLFSIMNVIQAMGRLRPKQREGGASIRIFIQPIRTNSELLYEERDRQSYTSLLAIKLIDNN
jgi:hypothetical protein